MPGKLKPLDVERETRSGKYPDGDGLYLIVASPTSKNWSYRYWKDGKQRWLGLGSLKDVSLKDARLTDPFASSLSSHGEFGGGIDRCAFGRRLPVHAVWDQSGATRLAHGKTCQIPDRLPNCASC